jgi:two-component sensor histidine kinase
LGDELEAENLALKELLAQAGVREDDHETADRLQRLLVKELHHRVKNTLTIAIAIVSQSLRTAKTVEEGKKAIQGRLLALSGAHDLLLEEHWTSTRLLSLVSQAIKPFHAYGDARFTVTGNDIAIPARPSLALAMALNELCTNAAKYGALSNQEGHVEIGWTTKPDKRLRLRWTESGGPQVQPPTRRGFGTQLIATAVEAETGGNTIVSFDPGGLTWSLDAPLSFRPD